MLHIVIVRIVIVDTIKWGFTEIFSLSIMFKVRWRKASFQVRSWLSLYDNNKRDIFPISTVASQKEQKKHKGTKPRIWDAPLWWAWVHADSLLDHWSEDLVANDEQVESASLLVAWKLILVPYFPPFLVQCLIMLCVGERCMLPKFQWELIDMRRLIGFQNK